MSDIEITPQIVTKNQSQAERIMIKFGICNSFDLKLFRNLT